MSILTEFRQFAVKGNAVDMAVGIIIGGAFGKLVTSLVNDIVMPPIGMLLGKAPFNDLYIQLGKGDFTTLADAKAAGVPTIAYGLFLNNVLDFVIMAFCIFMVIRQMNHVKLLLPNGKSQAEPATKTCPECLSAIPFKARRCAHCTATLDG